MELSTLGASLRTARHGVVNKFSLDDVTCFCGTDSALIGVYNCMGRPRFDKNIFRVLRCLHCNPILALSEITWLAEVECVVTGLAWSGFRLSTNDRG